MNYEVNVSEEVIKKIQAFGFKNLNITPARSNAAGLYHANVQGNGEILISTDEIFNSAEIAERVMKAIITSIIQDNISVEFAETICYKLSKF